MELGLRGKIAVITGGSVGIGLAIAEGLAAEGVDLLLVARDAARLEAEAARIAGQFGVRAQSVAGDVAEMAGIERIIAETRAFGGADILINNAGAGTRAG